MATFHINPNTGDPGPCRATIKCPYHQPLESHFASEAEARAAFEQVMAEPAPLTQREMDLRNGVRWAATDITIEANDSFRGNVELDGHHLEFIDALPQDLAFWQGRSRALATFYRDFTAPEPGWDDDWVPELGMVEHRPMGALLPARAANVMATEDGPMVVDYGFVEVDPNAELPWVGTEDEWRRTLDRTSFLGPPEWVPPPPDPRAGTLPTVEPGTPNPLLERAVLEPPLERHNGTTVQFLSVDQVRVACVHFRAEEGVPHLHSVETRREYQNQGYMKRLLSLLAKEHGVPRVISSGSYTPAGFERVHHLTDLPEGVEARLNFPEFTDDAPFSFVHNWVLGETN